MIRQRESKIKKKILIREVIFDSLNQIESIRSGPWQELLVHDFWAISWLKFNIFQLKLYINFIY